MSDSVPHLRSVRHQVDRLSHCIRALVHRVQPVIDYADTLARDSHRFPELAVILNPQAYRSLTTFVALDAWRKESERVARIQIPCLRSDYFRYQPEQFARSERTREAIKKLAVAQETPLLVVPVRIETAVSGSERVLAEGEFDFSLAATLTVLASHTKQWETEQRTLAFTALGETYAATPEAPRAYPVAGLRHGDRFIGMRDVASSHHHYVLTGYAP